MTLQIPQSAPVPTISSVPSGYKLVPEEVYSLFVAWLRNSGQDGEKVLSVKLPRSPEALVQDRANLVKVLTNGALSISEIKAHLSNTREQILVDLAHFRDKGLIRRVGSKKEGKYELVRR